MNIIRRGYAGLAHNTSPSSSSSLSGGIVTVVRDFLLKKKNHKPNGTTQSTTTPPSGKLDSITPGLASLDYLVDKQITSQLQQQDSVDPEVEIINAGPGSMALLKMQPNSSFYTTLGSVVGMSSGVEKKVILNGGPFHALVRGSVSGQFFMNKLSTTNGSMNTTSDVLVAPSKLSDIAKITLDNGEYVVRKDALLGLSPRLLLGSQWLLGNRLFHYVVSGRGCVLLGSYGNIFRLVLTQGEEYQVCMDHLIAYSSGVAVKRWGATDRMVRLVGPGDFYITSRIHGSSLGRLIKEGLDKKIPQNLFTKLQQQISPKKKE